MSPTHGKNLYLFVGTHKGAFMFIGDLSRKHWEMKGPFLKGADVNHIILDTRGEPTLDACATSYWWGPTFRSSKDFGATWLESETDVRFETGSGLEVKRTWCVMPGGPNEPNVLYVGVDPAALFKSEDGGRTWTDVKGLTNHSTREKWNPGAGGLMVHSVCFDPTDSKKMFVGISAAGVFYTTDGGKSWLPRNKGVLAEFLPDRYPEVGQCVHHLESHPAKPDVLYQQNHCGVYRSDDRGETWVDISEGLPSRFGFPIQIHPHDPDTVYVVPEEAAEFRAPVNGEFGVYRSRDRGTHWEKLTKGLPGKKAYIHMYRQAMAVDSANPAGIYVGTSGGEIWCSRDEGDSWELLVGWLPSIYSLSCAIV